MALIFWWSSIPNLKTGEGPPHWVARKIAHLLEYAILFLLWHRALGKGPLAKWQAGLIAFLYGVSDEVHQLFVPTRAPKISDIFFDLGGIFLGILASSFRVPPRKGATLLGLNPVLSRSAEQTRKLAADLAKSLPGGTILALAGELGSGKTTFVQGLARGLEINERIISPTFVLLREYERRSQKPKTKSQKYKPKIKSYGGPRIKKFYHLDLYRLESIDEVRNLDLGETLEDPEGLIVIEWAEKAKEILPPKTIWIYFENLGGDKRKIVIGD